MSKAIIPADEIDRLQALHDLAILDTDPESAFDSITLIAKTLFQTPVSALSPIDSDRQWFESMSGLSWSETPRDAAFCGHTILGDVPLVVPDAASDALFRDNPRVVGEPGIRFHTGIPLNTRGGSKIGALRVVDTKPRTGWSPLRSPMLSELARMVCREFEAHSLRKRERSLLIEDRQLRHKLGVRQTRVKRTK